MQSVTLLLFAGYSQMKVLAEHARWVIFGPCCHRGIYMLCLSLREVGVLRVIVMRLAFADASVTLMLMRSIDVVLPGEGGIVLRRVVEVAVIGRKVLTGTSKFARLALLLMCSSHFNELRMN